MKISSPHSNISKGSFPFPDPLTPPTKSGRDSWNPLGEGERGSHPSILTLKLPPAPPPLCSSHPTQAAEGWRQGEPGTEPHRPGGGGRRSTGPHCSPRSHLGGSLPGPFCPSPAVHHPASPWRFLRASELGFRQVCPFKIPHHPQPWALLDHWMAPQGPSLGP